MDIANFLDNIMGRNTKDPTWGFWGAQGVGKGIEDWTNPLTQMSGRNPILNLIKGTGGPFGANEKQSDSELNLNRMNAAAAIAYGGYAAGGAMGAEGTSSGGGAAVEGGAGAAAGASGTGAGTATAGSTSVGGSGYLTFNNVHRSLQIMNGINRIRLARGR